MPRNLEPSSPIPTAAGTCTLRKGTRPQVLQGLASSIKGVLHTQLLSLLGSWVAARGAPHLFRGANKGGAASQGRDGGGPLSWTGLFGWTKLVLHKCISL